MRRILPSILAYAVVSLVFIHCILRSRLWRREDNDVDAFDGLSIFVSSPSVVARGITPLISSHTVWTRHQQPLGMGTPRSVGRSEARNKALGCERVRKYRYHCVACMHACMSLLCTCNIAQNLFPSTDHRGIYCFLAFSDVCPFVGFHTHARVTRVCKHSPCP